jgi:hypothetical protein
LIETMLGNDDVKSLDGKESESGEVSSPVSRDQDSDQNPFNERNEELEERDPSSIRSLVAEDKSMEGVSSDIEVSQKIRSEDDGGVKIERELKSDESSESKNGSIEHVESAKEPHDGDDRSSSSSSSDDESQATEKKPKEEPYNLVLEANSCDDLVKPVDSLPLEVTWVTENAPVGETVNSIAERAPIVDSVKPMISVSEETIHITESAPVENLVIADMIEPGSKESEEKLSPKSKEAPAAVTDLALKQNEDKVFPLSDENVHASLTVVESVSNGYEGKTLPSSSAPATATSNGGTNEKDSESKILPSSSAPAAASSNGAANEIDSGGKILASSSAPVAGTSNGAANEKDSEIPECSENQVLPPYFLDFRFTVKCTKINVLIFCLIGM